MIQNLEVQRETPPHILLVDDEVDILSTYTDIFKLWGCQVTAVAQPVKAIELVEQEEFDLVITDLWMDEMGGIELIKAIRTRNPHLPVMVITAYATVKTAVQAFREGAVDYLAKPFSMETLRTSIQKILQGEDGTTKRGNKIPQEGTK